MNDIINFKCARIQSELDRYQRSKVIPHDLLEGSYSIDDVEDCLPHLSKEYQVIAKKLILVYTKNMQENLTELKIELRNEYENVTKNLETLHSDFAFPTVMTRYRSNINPVTALYYEARELMCRYNTEDPKHVWLLGLLQDREFNNKLVDSLARDIKRLDRIISRYYWATNKLSNNIPLELFHARQLTKDFKHYITMFTSILEWDPRH